MAVFSMKKLKEPLKMYFVQKKILASSVDEAIKIERRTPPHEVYLDPKYEEKRMEKIIKGFN
jgi:hypothetical protein